MNKKAFLLDLDLLKLAFAKNPDTVVKDLYYGFRDEFVMFAMKMTRDKEKVIDSYQDAIIVMHENLASNKIKENTSSVKTYLFSIGKYKLLNAISRENNLRSGDDLFKKQESASGLADNIDDDLKEELLKAMGQLGETCQKLMQYFYYRSYSIEAIMYAMNMKNENSVKANKSRCVKQLRSIMKKDINKSK